MTATAHTSHDLARITLLALHPGRPPQLIAPILERPDAEAAPAADALEFSDWQDGDALPMLRAVEGPDEVELLAAAGAAADAALEEIVKVRFAGRTEADIAADLAGFLKQFGHSQVDFTVVGSGPNGANPHHEMSERTIAEGDMVVLDFGGLKDGYGYDTTRTVHVGEPTEGRAPRRGLPGGRPRGAQGHLGACASRTSWWPPRTAAGASTTPATRCASSHERELRGGRPPPPPARRPLPRRRPGGGRASPRRLSMSTTDPAGTRATVRKYAPGELHYEEQRGEGWVLFAGMMLGTLGILNLIEGIAAVSKSKFFVANAQFVFSDLKTWGWIMIVIAVVQGVTAAGVFLNWKAVRWVGASIAGVNAIAQLLFLPAYPLWALCLFALDILVIYGLLAHAGPRE